MRKRRAILYDDDAAVLRVLTLFFEARGYEVIACGAPVACPVYHGGAQCDKMSPCGDVMITDLEMPRMSGLELLELQHRQGCKLTPRNKAVLSGSLDYACGQAIRSLGCATFLKPCPLGTLAAWVDECEQRMDLSQPLGIRRRERRDACDSSGAVFRVERETDLRTAEVLNRSDSGLCVRLDRPLAVAQVVSLQSRLPISSERLLVRWLRSDAGGGYLAGMSCLLNEPRSA
jgi:CheY-like chemotaxis protein